MLRLPRSLRSSRRNVVLALCSASAIVACVAAGCAESTTGFDDDADSGSDASAAKDARRDSTTSFDSATPDEDDAATEPGKDAAPGVDSSVTDASDAGKDASDASDASDAGDAADATDAADAAADADAAPPAATKPLQGEVVISEVLFNAAAGEPDTEWIEIHNTTATPRLLSGLVLEDGADRKHTIGAGVVVAAGAYVVLASNTAAVTASKVPAGVIVYEYGGGANPIQMANSANGSIVLLDGAAEIARAKYGPAAPAGLGLSSANNQSIQLKTLTYAGAGVAANWCKSANPWAVGADNGTPGAASDCP